MLLYFIVKKIAITIFLSIKSQPYTKNIFAKDNKFPRNMCQFDTFHQNERKKHETSTPSIDSNPMNK